jgi:putative protease
MLREYKHRTGIYSANKIFWGDRVREFDNLGLWGIRLAFVTENARECVTVTERYMGIGNYEPGEFTRGILDGV